MMGGYAITRGQPRVTRRREDGQSVRSAATAMSLRLHDPAGLGCRNVRRSGTGAEPEAIVDSTIHPVSVGPPESIPAM